MFVKQDQLKASTVTASRHQAQSLEASVSVRAVGRGRKPGPSPGPAEDAGPLGVSDDVGMKLGDAGEGGGHTETRQGSVCENTHKDAQMTPRWTCASRHSAKGHTHTPTELCLVPD